MNKQLLKSEMAKKELTVSDIAKILGLSRPGTSLKMNYKNEFTATEISKLKETFSLSAEETCKIFLE